MYLYTCIYIVHVYTCVHGHMWGECEQTPSVPSESMTVNIESLLSAGTLVGKCTPGSLACLCTLYM